MIDSLLKCFVMFAELYFIAIIILIVSRLITIRRRKRYTEARRIRRMRQIEFNQQCAEKGAELAYIDSIRSDNTTHKINKQKVIYKGYFTLADVESLENSNE